MAVEVDLNIRFACFIMFAQLPSGGGEVTLEGRSTVRNFRCVRSFTHRGSSDVGRSVITLFWHRVFSCFFSFFQLTAMGYP